MKNTVIRYYKPPIGIKETQKIISKLAPYIIPPLIGRVDIEEYTKKIGSYADMINLETEEDIVGNLAIYLNRAEGFITSFVIHPSFQGMGYGKKMLENAEEIAINNGIYKICLEVYSDNYSARQFYVKQGFVTVKQECNWIRMNKKLREEK